MKKNILFIILLSFISVGSFAQEEATAKTEAEEKDFPVNATFESGLLIDAQTVVIPEAKTLEMIIQHKFGTLEKGRTDLWGIYGSANIRFPVYAPIFNNRFERKMDYSAADPQKYHSSISSIVWCYRN